MNVGRMISRQSAAILGLLSIGSIGYADDKLVNDQIAKLSSPDVGQRLSAAEELRRLLVGDFNATTDNRGRQYWEERLNLVKPGMTHEAVLRVLPPVDKNMSGAGSGQTHNKSWRLDDYWVVIVHYNNPDVVHEMRPSLSRRVRAVWVAPPADFSGKWTTWHVNGQLAHEIDYKDGKYHGAYLAFHDNGRRAYEQHYLHGICKGTDRGWYPDGSKSYEGQYLDDKQTGTWTHWYQDGRLQSRYEVRNGQRQGAGASWEENGQKRIERD